MNGAPVRISLDKKPARFALAARNEAGETRTTDWIPAIAGMTAWAGMTGSESHRLATLGHTLWSSAPPPPKEVGHPANSPIIVPFVSAFLRAPEPHLMDASRMSRAAG